MAAKLPTFICVGAQKAGTTSLHDVLSGVPGIYLPKQKETKFFQNSEFYARGIEYYLETYFKDCNDGDICGEVDPEYLYFESVPKRIYDSLGEDVKFLFMLRNPIDRAYSHYLMSKRRGFEDLTFAEAISFESERISDGSNDNQYFSQKNHFSYIDRGYYSEQIQRYLEFFPVENMLFIIFESDFIADKKATFDRILGFIGFDEKLAIVPNLRSNSAASAKSKLVARALNGQGSLKKVVKFIFPFSNLRTKCRLFLTKYNLGPSKDSKISENERAEIYNRFYVKEIAKLEELIGRNLDEWKK